MSEEARVTSQIGAAVQVLLATERRKWRIATVQAFIEPPVRLGQIQFLTCERGHTLGYATWAYLSSETESALLRDPRYVLDPDEWNEGFHLWIMDIVAPANALWDLVRQVRVRLSSHARVRWLRPKLEQGGRVYREAQLVRGGGDA